MNTQKRYTVRTHRTETAVIDTTDQNAVYVLPHNTITARQIAIRRANQHAKELNAIPIEHTLDECRDMQCGCRELAQPNPDTAQHSPLPWRLDGSSIRGTFEGEDVQIAAMFTTSWTHPDQDKNARFREATKANAAYIVKAANAYHAAEALAEALKYIANFGGDCFHHDEVVNRARQALAQWEGAQQ